MRRRERERGVSLSVEERRKKKEENVLLLLLLLLRGIRTHSATKWSRRPHSQPPMGWLKAWAYVECCMG